MSRAGNRPATAAELGPVEHFLRLFTDVRRGEAPTALLLTLNVLLILCAYSLLKVLRDTLILAEGGAEVKSYSAAGQAVLLLGAVPLYGMLANKLPRKRLINYVTAFFLVCLVGFFAISRFGVHVGVPFFLWVGIFNVMVVAQFWSFANDVYTNEEGKRLFAIVAFGQSAGAVLGAYMAGRAIDWLGLNSIFVLAAALLVLATVVTNAVDVRERRRTEAARSLTESTAMMPASTKEVRLESGEFRIADLIAEAEGKPATPVPPARPKPAPQPIGKGGAFGIVFGNRYLLLIAFMILVLNWVNSTGGYVLDRTIKAAAAAAASGGGVSEGEIIGKFYSGFQLGVNVIGFATQLFLVSRILKWFGARVAVLILPAIALFGYGAMAFVPVLAVVRWVKTAENAADYSVQNTVQQVLFLPMTREQKYKGKQAIDSFFKRAGDVLSAGLVYLGTQILTIPTQQFALVNMVLVVIWLVLAVMIGREYVKVAAQVEVDGPAKA